MVGVSGWRAGSLRGAGAPSAHLEAPWLMFGAVCNLQAPFWALEGPLGGPCRPPWGRLVARMGWQKSGAEAAQWRRAVAPLLRRSCAAFVPLYGALADEFLGKTPSHCHEFV